MKGCKRLLRVIGAATAVVAVLATAALPTQAALYTMADGGSVVGFDTTPLAGLSGWTIGGVNQLTLQSYWFRIGATGGEANISALGTPTVTQAYGAGGRELTATFTSVQFGLKVQLSYNLSGASSSAGLNEQISIFNLNASAPLDLHFYRYADLDLGGALGGQTVAIQALSGRPYKATQTMPGMTATTTLVSSADSAEADLVPSTLVKLTDAAPTSFAGSSLTKGPGNVADAFEWDYSIAGGGSKLISIVQSIQVPEPSSLALIAAGAVLWALRRRQTA